MLEDMQRLFRRTWESFREELGRREPEDEIAGLLTSMRQELVDTRAAIKELDVSIERAARLLEAEKVELDRCERRAAMAQRIDDEETARVALEFADKHRQRAAVQEQKLQALRAEHRLRSGEAEEMKLRYLEADRNRFALLAQLRRTRARSGMESSGGDDDPFAVFSRIEETMEGDSAYADALGDIADPPERPPPGPSATELEERLRELKRRMGQDH